MTDGWDFFVSYQQADRTWAEWIAWQLKADGHAVLFQGWHFVPGSNWVDLMHKGVMYSSRVIAVLSPAYKDSEFGSAEWQSKWITDPTGAGRRIIPVRVADCEWPGLLAGVVGIDLFGVPESKARKRLLKGVARALADSAEPSTPPAFPTLEESGSLARHAAPVPQGQPQFPGSRFDIRIKDARGVQIGDGNEQNNFF